MRASTEANAAYERGAVADGAFTRIPRWTHAPVPGTAEHGTALPAPLLATLRQLADRLEVPLSSVLLAAHAKVLAALSGDHEVTTGCPAAPGGTPLPCRLTTASGSWRDLVLDAHRAAAELPVRREPVGGPGPEPGRAGESPETVFDLLGEGGGPAGDTVLWVDVSRDGGQGVLRLRYRTDVLDKDCAARVGGYYRTALTLIAADPDAEHRRQSLLSAEELRLQLEGLAGPSRELPDRRFHEVFEEQVRAHPDAVAAVQGDRQWTYRELNVHANRLAHALLAGGLRREGVVAVVTERSLGWMAAVIAVFKAGGVYLPIEPHFPPDRIAVMFSRAECRHVLTEPGSAAGLDQALASVPGVRTLFLDAVWEADHPDSDPGVRVDPDQLAYIYFTSGSTGEPKGAMCEHMGMLNHLYAKIDDLAVDEGQVVAQTAPQCFDISLWQLLSALLVGGRTVLVEQAAVLDVRRFLDTVADGRVTVLQVVPSYLDVVLSYLEHRPRELPDLRCVSVTGEALKKELVHRWFTARPGIRLVNAYGLTETSDDTNHEVMDGVPDTERVPVGRPVNNVHVYVVDEHLAPVPLGAPGAIVFSGVCVGRGYINDPERTRPAFMPDPHRPGQRLFRGGDHGRWLPDGKLEFLGRKDSQVKIRGFRIEIGEVENALLRVPGVGDGAVVVTGRAGHSKRLVAFYSGRHARQADVLRGRLGELLPEYMVPSVFLWRESLPLTANGKIDKKALEALAGELDAPEPDAAGDDDHAPRTPTERRLAAAWAKVLGIPQEQIGRQDNFFDRGGTSLSAVELAVTLGRLVSVKDLTRHPVLADLAGQVDGGSEPRPGIVRPLSEAGAAQAGSLVCFPSVSGNTDEFQTLAEALQGTGPTLYAVALPAPGTVAAGEPTAPMTQVAEQVADEIVSLRLTGLRLWGQSSGTALAVATAQRLEERGVEVRRVFLGAQLPGSAVDSPPAVKLSAPLTVVVAADDPHTAGFARRYLDRQRLAERVDLHELPDGGHFFLQTRAKDAAQAVLCDLERPASSRAATERSTTMLSSLPISLPELEREPGRPPMLRVGLTDGAASWAAARRDALRAVVAEHGSVVVRGLGLRDPAEVGAVLQGLGVAPVTEREAFALRQTYSEGVYSSSKWPPTQPMCMHHELSYTLEFPGLMLFVCLGAPTEGGATAVADSTAVLDALPAALTERFEREGWLLTRSYNEEIGASLEQAFGTEDRGAIEQYCRAHAIECAWQPDGALRTRQRRSAVVRHPVSGRRCWFNQIAFLNEWTMAPEVREYLIDEYGPDGLPFNTRYGNGDPVTEDVVHLLNEVYEAHTARRPWEAGDLLLIDNVRTAHSREPFEGPRDVVVALADPVRLADCSPTVEVTLP